MLPGMGMDPKQMGSMLKQMGVKTTELESEKVIITLKDGGQVEILTPSVTEIEFRGQKSFQISGTVKQSVAPSEAGHQEDVKIVMAQTGATAAGAQAALDACGGNLAQAILKLKK
jgi:nascent polypeptide-associated complex subunit alpha